MEKYKLPDRNQNFWQLASIQSTGLGLPGMLIGGQLAKEYGAGTALISVIIGNLILWIISLWIISMAALDRKNAIDNVRRYLGKWSSLIASFILMIAFLTWYILQLKATTTALGGLFQNYKQWQGDIEIRLGAALGLIIALFAIGGIRLIKWICTIGLPLLLIFAVYYIVTSNYSPVFKGTWNFSFQAILLAVLVTLSGIINLPTFFRHSRSRADSFFGLSLMTLFVSFFQIFTILVGIAEPSELFQLNYDHSNLNISMILTFSFLFLSLICINLVNIYFASAGWEAIIPHVWSPKEYAIVGLLGTAAYTFLQIASPMKFLEQMAESFISSLGAVLLMAFLVKIIVKHRPRPLEKMMSSICWLVGCLTSAVIHTKTSMGANQALMSGVSASVLAFLIIVIIEETVWSMKQLPLTKKESSTK